MVVHPPCSLHLISTRLFGLRSRLLKLKMSSEQTVGEMIREGKKRRRDNVSPVCLVERQGGCGLDCFEVDAPPIMMGKVQRRWIEGGGKMLLLVRMTFFLTTRK
jgi:hypothetical protein